MGREDLINSMFPKSKTICSTVKNLRLVAALLLCVACTVSSFSSRTYGTTSIQQSQIQRQQQQQQQRLHNQIVLFATRSKSTTGSNNFKKKNPFSLRVPTISIPDPFASLPWNVRRAKEREQKRLQIERATLHRQLGIVEDATYEEIVEATNTLLAKAGTDLKEKIKIEVAKDKILQIRLNERLAGLTINNQEARAMSTYETDGYVMYF
jgi:Protein CHAPERONE-LIKE PROTEIN OF POR1-like